MSWTRASPGSTRFAGRRAERAGWTVGRCGPALPSLTDPCRSTWNATPSAPARWGRASSLATPDGRRRSADLGCSEGDGPTERGDVDHRGSAPRGLLASACPARAAGRQTDQPGPVSLRGLHPERCARSTDRWLELPTSPVELSASGSPPPSSLSPCSRPWTCGHACSRPGRAPDDRRPRTARPPAIRRHGSLVGSPRCGAPSDPRGARTPSGPRARRSEPGRGTRMARVRSGSTRRR
jgi:hypothetical protein